MTELISFLLILNTMQLLVTGVLVWNLVKPEKVSETAGVAEKEPPNPMDEGFENIMAYSVNGKTGFEREF